MSPALVDELREVAGIESYDGRYRGLRDVVLSEGRHHRPAEVPAELRRRRARSHHRCFDRSWTLAMESEWVYVEGFVMMDLGGLGIQIHHAWLTGSSGEAVDLALPFDPDREYFGVPIETASLAKATSRLDRIGDYLSDPELWHSGFGPDTLTIAA